MLKVASPNGLIEPGEEYDNFLDRIENEFLQIIDLDTNEPAIEEIVRVREKYKGDENVEDLA